MDERFLRYSGKVTVTDGAWGTRFQAQGLPPGACPDAWNLENPGAVEAVARAYVQAGSQVILTNTFQSNRFVLERWGLGDRAGTLAQAGAAISRKAAGQGVAVFGSIGPTGKILMMGDVAPDPVRAAFAEQAAGLARGGADAIVCETFAELEELRLAIEGARGGADLPVVACMTFDSGPDKTRTMMGTSPEEFAAGALEAGADAVGANCGAGPEHYVAIARILRQATDAPIWIKPNAGLPVQRDGRTVFPLGPAEFAAFVPDLIAAGANFIGGCCGTGPEHVREMRRVVDRR